MFAVKDLAGRAAQRVFGDFGTFMLWRTVHSLTGSDDSAVPHAEAWRDEAPFCTGYDTGRARARDCHRVHA